MASWVMWPGERKEECMGPWDGAMQTTTQAAPQAVFVFVRARAYKARPASPSHRTGSCSRGARTHHSPHGRGWRGGCGG